MESDFEYGLQQMKKWFPKTYAMHKRAYEYAEAWYQGFSDLVPLLESIEQEMQEQDLALAQWADDGGAQYGRSF